MTFTYFIDECKEISIELKDDFTLKELLYKRFIGKLAVVDEVRIYCGGEAFSCKIEELQKRYNRYLRYNVSDLRLYQEYHVKTVLSIILYKPKKYYKINYPVVKNL